MINADVAACIGRWEPSSVSPAAAAFARAVVAKAAPERRERARCLLWAAGKLAGYGTGLGLEAVPEAVPEVLLHPSTAGRFTRCAPGLSPVARRTLRRTCGSSAAGSCRAFTRPTRRCPGSGPSTLTARRRSPGSSPWRTPGPQPGGGRGRPGLSASGRARGWSAVTCARSAAPTWPAAPAASSSRSGARGRAVPVLARYQGRLLAAAGFAGDGLVCGGAGPGRRNLTCPLAAALDGGAGLPRLDTSRLRATWLAGCGELLGLATFMNAAGISCSQRLGDLVAGLEPGSEEQAVALLGAARP